MFIWFMRWQEFWKRKSEEVALCFKCHAPNGHHAGHMGFYGDVSLWESKALMAVDFGQQYISFFGLLKK
ncbi:MAG: hypothetical protein V8T37_04085 [Streptococcus sp.]